MDAGGADCTSVPCGPTASMGPGCEGFLGASAICGRRRLRAGLSLLFDAFSAFSFEFSADGIMGVVFGASSGGTSLPPGKLAESNHREMASFSSSIEAHPARAMPPDTAIAMSAPRALAIGRVAPSLR